MGLKTLITRRKKSARCWNDELEDQTHKLQPCNCTNNDWECDYGFFRSKEGDNCLPISDKYIID